MNEYNLSHLTWSMFQSFVFPCCKASCCLEGAAFWYVGIFPGEGSWIMLLPSSTIGDDRSVGTYHNNCAVNGATQKKRVVIFCLVKDECGKCDCDRGGRPILSMWWIRWVHMKMKGTTFGENNNCPGERCCLLHVK